MTTGWNKNLKMAEDERRARRAAAKLRNDGLLEIDGFRDFLAAIADRAEYFGADYSRPDEWYAGYHAALRDMVNGVVMNSSAGAEWLREYAAKKAARNEKQETEE